MFNLLNWEDVLSRAIESKEKEICLFTQNMTDGPIVTTSVNSEYNKQYCEDNKITVIGGGYEGGTLVFFPNDIAICWFSEKFLLGEILGHINNYLITKIPNLDTSNNDIMVDGYKLFGTMERKLYNDLYFGGFFLSFNSDVELIRNICTKPMEKVPIGLSKFGVDINKIKDILNNCIKKYNLTLFE